MNKKVPRAHSNATHILVRVPSDWGAITQSGYRRIAHTQAQYKALCAVYHVVNGTSERSGGLFEVVDGRMKRLVSGEFAYERLTKKLWAGWVHTVQYALNNPGYA